MIDKKKVKRSFSRAASSYDTAAILQAEVAGELAGIVSSAVAGNICLAGHGHIGRGARLQNINFAGGHTAGQGLRVLDAGSGTGSLAFMLRDVLPGARIISADIAHPMLVKARSKQANGLFTAGDFEALPFAANCFDAVVSSLAYQWACGMGAAFGEAFRALKPGGFFAFSTLGTKTLHELRQSCLEACDSAVPEKGLSFLRFSNCDEIKTSLEAEGFEEVASEAKIKVREYESMGALLCALKAVGANIPAGGAVMSRAALLEKAGRIYLERFSYGSGISATYDVIYFLARKPLHG